MRSIPLTFCGAAVIAATLMHAPAALAESGSGSEKDPGSGTTLTVTPSSVAPGGQVDLQTNGCRGKEAKGISDAFDSDARFSPEGSDGLFAEGKIRSDAEPGEYDIWVSCGDSKDTEVSGTLTVVDRNQQPPLTPTAPVQAGGGGTAVLAEQAAQQNGPSAVQAVVGLVLAVAATASVALRSVRRRRPAAD
ncbi:hypothetical protein [Streptomyces sp. LN785]|uniref:hypothetical protein n=1 Tax=Streptomyces sp. LN785 TaxID=3112983 RepID=UPI0037219E5D